MDLRTLAASDVLHSEPLSPNAINELLRKAGGAERAWENVPVLGRSRVRDVFRDREGNIGVELLIIPGRQCDSVHRIGSLLSIRGKTDKGRTVSALPSKFAFWAVRI